MDSPEELYRSFPIGRSETLATDFYRSIAGDASNSPERPVPAVAGKCVALCFTNRTGSNLVALTLAQHGVFCRPNRGTNYEFFNGPDVVRVCQKRGIGSLPEYVSHLIEERTGPLGYFSTKLYADQLVWLLRAGVIPSQLARPHFIYVVRRNIVAQAVSHSIANQTRQWTSLYPRQDVELRYDFDELLKIVERIVRANGLFELLFDLHSISPLRLVYEDVSEQPDLIVKGFSAHFSVVLADTNEQVPRLSRQGTEMNQEWEHRFRMQYAPLGDR
jgi:LPS sulfotransferase NodH